MASFLDDKEKLIELIKESTGKSEEEILKLIEEKKIKFSGLLTDSGAAFMIAKDLKVDLKLEDSLTELIKIGSLEDGMNNINLEVSVKQVFASKEFEKNGKKGKLVNLVVEDETGEIRLTLWHKDVALLEEKKISKGDKILLRNCYVSSFNEKLQLNLGYNGEIKLKEKAKQELKKIKDLKENMASVDLIARIIKMYGKKDFSSEKASGSLYNFEIGDDSGTIRVTAWNELASELEKFRVGDAVKIEGAYTKKGLNAVELNLGWTARILKQETELDLPKVNELVSYNYEKMKVEDLSGKDSFKELHGTIVSLNKNKLSFNVCSKCRKRVKEFENKFVCEEHGETIPEKNFVFSFELDDGTGIIRCVLFGELVPELLDLSKEKLLKEIEAKGSEAFIEGIEDELTGKPITVKGSVKKNSLNHESEFFVKELKLINENKVEVSKSFIE